MLVDGDSGAAEEAFAALLPLGGNLCRLERFLTRFPAELKSDEPEQCATLELAPPRERPLWCDDGLHAEVRLTVYGPHEGGLAERHEANPVR
ncbi:hypothetical protein [Nannocystis pusilla]|uniref:hypothetical protein n=1 Tax=Nannocystis pusilla TaxID=889268 RepID=UPI003BF329CE